MISDCISQVNYYYPTVPIKVSTSNLNKLTVLTNQLLEKKTRFGSSFRCIVFVQQRISAHIICDYINKETNLSDSDIISGYVAARGSSITPSIKLSPSQSKKVLVDFRSGTINILVATSVAEEVSMRYCKTFFAAILLNTSNVIAVSITPFFIL